MSEYVVTINGSKKLVNIINENEASVDGKVVDYSLESLNCSTYLLRISNNFYEISSEKIDDEKYEEERKQRDELTSAHECAYLSKDYFTYVNDWFDSAEDLIEEKKKAEDEAKK